MKVNNLNIFGTIIPSKANTVLAIDSDTVFSLAVALWSLKSVARRTAQVIQDMSAGQHSQFSSGRGFNAHKFLYSLTVEQVSGVCASKRFYHEKYRLSIND